MILRKTVSIICATCVLFTVAFANSTTVNVSPAPEHLVGTLVNEEDGTTIEIAGVLVNEPSPFSLNLSDEKKLTYMFEVPLAYTYQDHSDEVNKSDSSLSIKAYLTIGYREKEIPNENNEFLLTSVSGKYVIYDNQVTVTSSYVSYGSNGSLPQMVDNQSVIDKPISGSSFSIKTGFTKYVIKLGSEVGAYYTLNLARGDRKSVV